MALRAKQGGQRGANGEWYKGGQFVNTIPENDKRHGSRPRTARKVEIEPYSWQPGRDDAFPVYAIAGTLATISRENNQMAPNAQAVAYYGSTFRGYSIQELCDLWNAGERWATIRTDP